MNGTHLLFAWGGWLVGFLCYPFLFPRAKKPPPEQLDMWTATGEETWTRTGTWKL